MDQKEPPAEDVNALEKAYKEALALFKADKTNKDLRRARTAAKRAWDKAVLRGCGDTQVQQLQCKDCSQMFLWTGEDQDFYRASDWKHKPQRCKKCIESQKKRHIKTNKTNNNDSGNNNNNNNNNNNKNTTETNAKLENETARGNTRKNGGKAGKNMCYAFQRGNCPYGDRCKFNHDPDFVTKKDGDSDGDGNGGGSDGRKRKISVAPDTIALCKWGMNCTMKRCRYRHEANVLVKDVDDEEISNNPCNNESLRCTEIPTATKKAKLTMEICKWGKNCKLKRCRFRHVDDSEDTSSATDADSSENTGTSGTKLSESQISIDGEAETQSKLKSKSKSTEKTVAKALTKALKRAPKKELKMKDLKKLVRENIEDSLGKDEIKIIIKDTIAKNKDSMTLIEDKRVVKLLV